MSTYEKLLKLKRNTRDDYFVMACSYLFDIGYQNAKEITDEEIENAKVNGIMTKEFCEWLMKTAREIANTIDSAIELVQFCMVEDVYDLKLFANKLPRYRLQEMIENQIYIHKGSSQSECEKQCEEFGCEMEELEMLGFDLPDGWWEWE